MPSPQPNPNQQTKCGAQEASQVRILSLRDTFAYKGHCDVLENGQNRNAHVFFPRPINITPLCKLSPILANTVNVKWAADYGETSNMFPKEALDIIFSGKGWVVGIWLVEKLSSEQVVFIFWSTISLIVYCV